MAINEKLLEVREYTRVGYSPVVDYGAWRVAILNYIDELLPENLTKMQRHDQTDEVFILLHGRCILFLGDGTQTVTTVYAEDMQPTKMYNVKKGAWHTHTLSEDAMVLIVENRDTNDSNSPCTPLSDAQRKSIVELTRAVWK